MTAPVKNRLWLWYFIALGVLSLIATSTLVVYNLRQQLKHEHVKAAIELWKTSGPANYVLVYTEKQNTDKGEVNDHFVVKVKNGEVYEVLANGTPLNEREFSQHGMLSLLQKIDAFMDSDAQAGKPKTFTRGLFDGKTGALGWYVRRVMKSQVRIEITVESLVVK